MATAEDEGFMAKVKVKAAEIGDKLKEGMSVAGDKGSEFSAKVAEKYNEYKTDLGPKALQAKESLDVGVEKVSVAVGGLAEKVLAPEWQEPYDGKVFQACLCSLGVLDLTWPSCVGIRYKGLCCCIDGELTMCLMGESNVDGSRPYNCWDTSLMYVKPPYLEKDEATGERGGALCKSVCSCCCYEERFSFPNDNEVPMLLSCCFVTFMQKNAEGKPEFKMKTKLAAPPAKTLAELKRVTEKRDEKAAEGYTDGTDPAAPVPQVMEAEMAPAPTAADDDDEVNYPKSNTYFKACKYESKKIVADKGVAVAKAALEAASSDEEKSAASEALKAAEAKAAEATAGLEAVCTDLAIEQAAMAAAASEELDDEIPSAIQKKLTGLTKAKSGALALTKAASSIDNANTHANARDLFTKVADGIVQQREGAAMGGVVTSVLVWKQVGGVWKRIPKH